MIGIVYTEYCAMLFTKNEKEILKVAEEIAKALEQEKNSEMSEIFKNLLDQQ